MSSKINLSSALASAAFRLKVVVVLLLIHCLLLLSIFVGYVWHLFCIAVLSVVSSFEVISLRKRELVALSLLCSYCRVTVSSMSLPRCAVGWFVVVAFPDHTRSLPNDP